MAGRLKLLQFTQKLYEDMGVYPPKSNHFWHSINWRNASMFISLIQMLIFSLAFLIFEAETIVDAGSSFYVVNTELTCSIFFFINFHNLPIILNLIEKFEDFIEQSKTLK